jgi:hypothetical protein
MRESKQREIIKPEWNLPSNQWDPRMRLIKLEETDLEETDVGSDIEIDNKKIE